MEKRESLERGYENATKRIFGILIVPDNVDTASYLEGLRRRISDTLDRITEAQHIALAAAEMGATGNPGDTPENIGRGNHSEGYADHD